VRFSWLVVASLVVLSPAVAAAGRSNYGWLTGTEVMPERGVELVTWLAEENHEGPGHSSETGLWWATTIGITDQLELSLPIQTGWERADGERSAFQLQSYGVEARWRLVTADPVDAPPLVPLLRAGVHRGVLERDAVLVEAEGVTAYEAGRLHAAASVGLRGAIQPGADHYELHPALGVSVRVTDELRLGVEAFGQVRLLDPGIVNWFAVGPDLAWTHGRFWLSAAYGVGVSGLDTAPRLNWGVAL
jgi:hypothetical protein